MGRVSTKENKTVYTVSFLNYDDTLLLKIEVIEGDKAIYKGETPIKKEDSEFTYEFIGWDKELNNIQSDLITRAQFKPVPKENWGDISWFE